MLGGVGLGVVGASQSASRCARRTKARRGCADGALAIAPEATRRVRSTMPLYEIEADQIRPIERTTFREAELRERSDLQRLLRDQVDVVAPGTLVIAEEFGEWTDSRRRIDLLAIDGDANLVVIELKRTEDGGHMELQAVRYAAMVSTLTAERAVEIYEQYLAGRDIEADAAQRMLDFLGWDELDEDRFGQDVRILLVSADFSQELTTSVLWLNEKGIDVTCVRMRPYAYEGNRTLVDVQQLIPLLEAADYQVGVREKKREERRARASARDHRRYDISFAGQRHEGQWKVHAIWRVVRHLLDQGVSPDEIAALFDPHRRSRTWFVLDEEVETMEEFCARAAARDAAGGRRFDTRRWRLDEDDLVVSDGRSYAFTKMWGAQWAACLEAIRDKWPELGLEWGASGE